MQTKATPRANPLGDLRAEYDHPMLERAFYESPDYRTLIESADRTVIVGRRGSGKSALFYKLQKHWSASQRTSVITIAPEDYEIIGLHGVLHPFSGRFNLVRAAAKLGWRYALVMEIATQLRSHFKFSQVPGINLLLAALKDWSQTTGSVPIKIRRKLEPHLRDGRTPESLIGDLASALQLNQLTQELTICLDTLGQDVCVLIDRLDEGYESNERGIGLIDGFLHSSIEINKALPRTKALMFLRDNIYRAISKHDADHSRQIEGQVIRLHWDEYHLLNLIANRLRAAFNLKEEQSIQVWNQVTSGNLVQRDGFRRCLRLTLYRPRDLLVLLNNAFYHANQHNRNVLHDEDIEVSAKEISENRYSDLIKEYTAVFPGIQRLTAAFANGPGSRSAQEACELLTNTLSAPDLDSAESQHFAILADPEGAIQALYSVGFLGVLDQTSGTAKFCHDGSQTRADPPKAGNLFVHPCYWRALNIQTADLGPEEADTMPPTITEIRDEYDIEVASTTPDIRNHRIGQIVAALANIPQGESGASRFEDWCQQAISILFAAGLRNVELRPNRDAIQRRDIVARNQGTAEAWKRILQDYTARQVIFEVKNYTDLGPTEYRQLNSYLVREYGRIGFIITREDDESIKKDKDLGWVREIYHEHGNLLVKLTGKWLNKYLGKARSPQKHDAADTALSGLLDRYVRNYLSLRHP
jgi:hypothetical protein